MNLPLANEAERAIAGLCINQPEEAAQKLSAAYFSPFWIVDPISKNVITTVLDRVSRGTPCDFVSLLTALRLTRPSFQAHELTDLSLSGAIGSALSSWLEIVQATYQRRQSLILANRLLQDLQGTDSTVALLQQAKAEMAGLLKTNTRAAVTWEQLLTRQQALWIEGRDDSKVVKTGIRGLDKEMLLEASDMLVIGGGTGSGKTMLGLNIVTNAMLQGLGPALLFTLEMTAGQVTNRLVSNLSGIPVQKLKAGRLPKQELDAAVFAAEQTKGWPLEVHDDCHTLESILSTARHCHASRGLSLIMVDYLQLVKNTDKELREQQVADVSRTLRLLGLETGALVLAIIQLNSQGESRESKQILMDATQVLTVRLIDMDGQPLAKLTSETEVDDSKRLLEIGKQRDGVVGIAVKVHFNGATSSFR
jgi:replicative DNA helicase